MTKTFVQLTFANLDSARAFVQLAGGLADSVLILQEPETGDKPKAAGGRSTNSKCCDSVMDIMREVAAEGHPQVHYTAVGVKLATRGFSESSAAPACAALAQDGKLRRVRKGVYELV